MADVKGEKPEDTPKDERPPQTPSSEGEKPEAEPELAQNEEHPRPVLHGIPVTPVTAERPHEGKKIAVFEGLAGFFRLACYVLLRKVKLSQMRAALARLEGNLADQFVALGRRVLDLKVAHPEIEPLAKQVEAVDADIGSKRQEVRAIEAEPLSADPQIRAAETNLRKVKINKINETIHSLEAKARPLLDEIGRIAFRQKLAPEQLEPSFNRIVQAQKEVAEQQQRIADAQEEFEAVSPGTRTLAYAFWGAVAFIILVLLVIALRGCSSGPTPPPKAHLVSPAHVEHA